MTRNRSSSTDNKYLFRYAGLATQLLVAVGLAVFLGLKADQWLHTSPLLSCVVPLLSLIAIFYKLVRDTRNPKRKNETK
jgi:F0F1-type ATP synthase assembly protein I